MKNLPFVWNGETPLAQELVEPFCCASLWVTNKYCGLSSLTLWRRNGVGIRIQSQMHDVAERLEVGVLTFKLVGAGFLGERTVILPKEFDAPITVMKLLKEEAGSTLESGVILKAANGSQIIVVAAASPCNIAIQGVIDDLPCIFEPEYSLESYKIVPMEQCINKIVVDYNSVKKNLLFIQKSEILLTEELALPLCRVSLWMDNSHRPSSITLWGHGGSGIMIQAQPYELTEQVIVSVLGFGRVYEPYRKERIIEMPDGFNGPILVKKLALTEYYDGRYVESGIILEAMNGSRIIIVAGNSPHTIAVKGIADDLPHIFEPEYPLESYTIIPMI